MLSPQCWPSILTMPFLRLVLPLRIKILCAFSTKCQPARAASSKVGPLFTDDVHSKAGTIASSSRRVDCYYSRQWTSFQWFYFKRWISFQRLRLSVQRVGLACAQRFCVVVDSNIITTDVQNVCYHCVVTDFNLWQQFVVALVGCVVIVLTLFAVLWLQSSQRCSW